MRGRRLALGVVLAASPPEEQSSAEPLTPPTVLLLFSLRSTAPAVSEMEGSFRGEVEKGYGAPVDLQVEYLDLPDASVVPYARRLVDLLREKYAGRHVDVVVVAGGPGPALRPREPDGPVPRRPGGVHGRDPQEHRRLPLPPDVTGAFLVLEGQRTVARGPRPPPRGPPGGARRRVLPRGPGFRSVRQEARRGPEPRHWRRSRSAAFRSTSSSGGCRRLPRDSVVIFVSYRADSLGRSMVSRDVLRLVTRASSAPVYGAVAAWLGLGDRGRGPHRLPGPRREDGPPDLPDPPRGEPARPPAHRGAGRAASVRLAGAPALGNRRGERCPQGSVVLFREKTLWSEHGRAILGALALLVAQTLLIGALLVARRQRIVAQAGLREAEQRYRTVADFTHDWEYWRLPDGPSPTCHPPACVSPATRPRSSTGARRCSNEIVEPEDRPRWERSTGKLALAGAGAPGLELRIRRADGQVRWIEHVCLPVTGEDGRFLGLRGSNRDVTEKKQSEEQLRDALAEIQRLRDRLEADNTYLREQVEPEPGFEGIVGSSDVLRYVLSRVQQVAPTSSTVLLQGETGVGKELVAHAIHNLSPRQARPLVKLNCAALPASLVESELFGHEKGAFTGAVAQRKGRFEIADGCTLFLDEIGELPLELQAKLLRVIQDGEFERVGGTTTLKTDVRLVAATNRDLDEEVKAGPLPRGPLVPAERLPDHGAAAAAAARGHPAARPALRREALPQAGPARPPGLRRARCRTSQAHDWPGNVRELETVVERAVITSTGTGAAHRRREKLRPAAPAPAEALAPATSAEGPTDAGGAKRLTDLERGHIVATLERTHWRLEGENGAAALLGMNPSTLRSRMRKHGIRRPDRRPPDAA